MPLSKNTNRLSILVLFLCIIRFHIRSLPTTVSVYLFDALLLFVLIVKNQTLRISNDSAICCVSLMIISVFKTMIGLGDADTILALIKIVYYCVAFSEITLLLYYDFTPELFEKIIKFCFWYNIIIIIIQLFSLPGISNNLFCE